LLPNPISIACANAITSGSVLGNLAIFKSFQKKIVFLFNRKSAGLFFVLSCSVTLSIVFRLLFEPLHSDLFIFLYRHLYRRMLKFSGAL
jgi:hypothetical protein